MSDENLMCVADGCSNKAKFICTDGDPWCSMNCMKKEYEIEYTKVEIVTTIQCTSCHKDLTGVVCAKCKKPLENRKKVTCDFEANDHYCNGTCLRNGIIRETLE